MRNYDANLPLIVIHLPKTAGASIREVYKEWYSDGLLFHYFNEHTGEMPKRFDLDRMHSRERPIVVYGHFNRTRGFGVEHYYPNSEQFITILRDPFERAISGYFFVRKNSHNWKDQSRVPKDALRKHLINFKGSILNHFPCDIDIENYKEVIETQFIEIGTAEHLDESMLRISSKINKPYTRGSIKYLNATERDEEIPYDLREEFEAQRPLEYAIYYYVLEKYLQQDT